MDDSRTYKPCPEGPDGEHDFVDIHRASDDVLLKTICSYCGKDDVSQLMPEHSDRGRML